MSAPMVITIRAEIQIGNARPERVSGWQVRAYTDEPPQEVRTAIVTALRKVNENIQELLP